MRNIKSCRFLPYTLFFYRPAGTSRGILYEKLSYFLEATDSEGLKHYGECGLLKGLSIDDKPDYEKQLDHVCKAIVRDEEHLINLDDWPSIRCGLEILSQAQKASTSKPKDGNLFTEGKVGIPINGLIWMGEPTFMREQIVRKVEQGFRCIKMKVGAIDWKEEKALLEEMRTLGGKDLVIRVDANGAWDGSKETLRKFDTLAKIGVHSIEQPVEVGSHNDMKTLVSHGAVKVALDEELFHYKTNEQRAKLLDTLEVPYIVLKPSLVGGFEACDSWIKLCEERGIGYWITSALESNIALYSIAKYSYNHLKPGMFQGLGTGSLYENNIPSPLVIRGDEMFIDLSKGWDYQRLRS